MTRTKAPTIEHDSHLALCQQEYDEIKQRVDRAAVRVAVVTQKGGNATEWLRADSVLAEAIRDLGPVRVALNNALENR